ncbi:MAG: hypothetical protein AB1714_06405 [Acidobacteriota bacterium]
MAKLVRCTCYAALVCLAVGSVATAQTAMNTYCIQPPFMQTPLKPNIMIVLDNSGSMAYFAYDFNGSSTSTGFNPANDYYGYFNTSYWYTYANNAYTAAGLKSGARPANSWDGNFMNWLTMRRIDILREVLIGGDGTARSGTNTNDKLAEMADDTSRGYLKQVSSADLYTPYSGTRCFEFDTGNGVSQFRVDTVSPYNNCSGFSSYFAVKINVTDGIERETGIYQELSGNARFGLANYQHSNERGGHVILACMDQDPTSFVTTIKNEDPGGYTPLAETLWTMTGYFRQYTTVDSTNGPRYYSGQSSYQTGSSQDPYNYGTGGQTVMVPCAMSFVLMLTDGEPTKDLSIPSPPRGYSPTYTDSGSVSTPTWAGDCDPNYFWSKCGSIDGSHYVDDVSLWARVDLTGAGAPKRRDLRSDLTDDQYLTTYVVLADLGGQVSPDGRRLLRQAARNGGFTDSNGNYLPDVQSEYDRDGDGVPDNYFEASNGQELADKIRSALLDILKRASSSTSATVLASGEGQGANLLQAFFFPRKLLGTEELDWSGYLQNEWFYVDPYLKLSTIREDTVQDLKLNLRNDRIVEFFFDTADQQTKARLYRDNDGDGVKDAPTTPDATIPVENVKSLWEAGYQLFLRDPDPAALDPRRMYTSTDGTTLIEFKPTNVGSLVGPSPLNYLQAVGATDALKTADGVNIINYIRGYDIAGKRNRTTTITDSLGVPHTGTWKLGDIITSTAKIAGAVPLNQYHNVYKDGTYSAFVGSNDYLNRGMAFAGGNDGMMHAFKMGVLDFQWPGQTLSEKAWLTGTNLGREEWAYIPSNALPYLRYLMDPDYCHLFYVDGTPLLVDASISTTSGYVGPYQACPRATTVDASNVILESTWRTILIGSMRIGGATGCATGNCVQCPATARTSTNAPVGRSTFFAIDITDANNPDLLWEFADPGLGLSTTGAAVVRTKYDPGTGPVENANGNWYVVIGSGPTGPIDTVSHQFLAKSDQNLKLFVLDLKDGTLLRTIDTGLTESFCGNLLNSTVDSNKDYVDDAIYFGYTKKEGSGPSATWTDGGVWRLWVNGAVPATWTVSPMLTGIGTVTASITNLQDNILHEMWIFGGTGRFYWKDSSGNYDDPTTQRHLFGVKEPCYTTSDTFNFACSAPVSWAGLSDVTTTAVTPGTPIPGWKLALDLSDPLTGDKAERMVTNPLATFTGAILFTTTKPSGDLCSSGGKTYLWAIRYDIGSSGAGTLYGIGLIQTSTGAIEQTAIPAAFGSKIASNEAAISGTTLGRRTGEILGMSTTVAPPPIIIPKPYKRIISVIER